MNQRNISTSKGGTRIMPLLTISEYNQTVNDFKHLFLQEATELIGKKYEINDSNRIQVKIVFDYFIGVNSEVDLNKGLLLCGEFGTGKSTLFSAIRKFINTLFPYNPNAFKITSTEEIINYKIGINESDLLFNSEDEIVKPLHLLINEFGHDYNIKIYGSDADSMIESFLMKRYDIFQQHGKVTHITTNLTKEAMISKLKPVIFDRFKEMFNIIELNGQSFRK